MPLDVIHRYKPIVDILRCEELCRCSGVVLEVGSGNGGLAQYVADLDIVNCDISFDGVKLAHVRYVGGSADRLPLKDRSCAWVISVDMLEHVAEEKRDDVIRELSRVARNGIILAFPDGVKVSPYEKAFRSVYRLTGRRHVWMEDHSKYAVPEAAHVQKVLGEAVSGCGFVKVVKNVNLLMWFSSMIASLPLLALGRLCRLSLKTYMRLFGWTTRMVTFGDCYRAIVVCKRAK